MRALSGEAWCDSGDSLCEELAERRRAIEEACIFGMHFVSHEPTATLMLRSFESGHAIGSAEACVCVCGGEASEQTMAATDGHMHAACIMVDVASLFCREVHRASLDERFTQRPSASPPKS